MSCKLDTVLYKAACVLNHVLSYGVVFLIVDMHGARDEGAVLGVAPYTITPINLLEKVRFLFPQTYALLT